MLRLINFKSERQAREWSDPRLDGRLRVIAYALAGFAFDRFGKSLVITEIFRTADERRSLYADNQVMREKVGVHEVGRALDFRTIGFTPDEIGAMVQFLTRSFDYTGRLATALYHSVAGYHIHVQVDGDGVTEMKGGPIMVPPEPNAED